MKDPVSHGTLAVSLIPPLALGEGKVRAKQSQGKRTRFPDGQTLI
jgi:hypothetical protein